MSGHKFADVILPLPVGDKFTYRVPPEFEKKIQVGIRVIVQFGAKKFFSALVYQLHSNTPEGSFNIKQIEDILDEKPVVTPSQIILWEWIADYYCCTLGEVYKAALPSALKLESQTKISYNQDYEIQDDISGDEDALLLMLQGHGQTNIQDINRFLGKRPAFSTIKNLLEKNAIRIEEKISESYRPKTAPFISLSPGLDSEESLQKILENLKRAPKQLSLLECFLAETIYNPEKKNSIEKKILLKKSKVSEGVFRSLADKKILQIEDIEIGRLDFSSKSEQQIFELNKAQQIAYEEIKEQLTRNKPVLLHGVTSSGKTEIYIKLIEEQLAKGNQVLYLVPEIGLTTQLITRMKRAFGNKAGIYHSKFNDTERVETWLNILNNDKQSFKIVLGARSAVFLPFKKLGLIIVDEEHESSYKQFDPAPRYNARDVAVILGQIHKAKVILGTATPSFESYFNAKTGKYALTEITERYQNISLPKIIISDIRMATRTRRMKSMLTPELYDEILSAIEKEEQVILFQNRRGFAPYLQCKTCGWIPKCKHCDVSLTYHKHRSALICHYCGHTQSLPSSCSNCQSEDIQTHGYGTEKIEEELQLLFPIAKIARMDLDSTRAKKGYERLIYQFESKQIDILVGTQMVTKGLDFDNVSVVGVLNADQLLSYPDFRSFERAYQLIAQVSGRAGRKNKQGKVIIQTSQPKHPVLAEVSNNDFKPSFNRQMLERKLFRYPPYFRLIKVVVKHKNADRLELAANHLATNLKKIFKTNVLGPEYPVISRIQNWYQKEIWVKLDRNNKLDNSKKLIINEIAKIKSQPNNTNLLIFPDIDPM